MDRIDLALRIDRLPPERLLDHDRAESSVSVRARVEAARAFAVAQRGAAAGTLSGRDLLAACRMDRAARFSLTEHAKHFALSGRGVTRMLRVARTIADLAGDETVCEGHVLEAAAYRGHVS